MNWSYRGGLDDLRHETGLEYRITTSPPSRDELIATPLIGVDPAGGGQADRLVRVSVCCDRCGAIFLAASPPADPRESQGGHVPVSGKLIRPLPCR